MSDLLPDGSALGRLIFRFMRLRRRGPTLGACGVFCCVFYQLVFQKYDPFFGIVFQKIILCIRLSPPLVVFLLYLDNKSAILVHTQQPVQFLFHRKHSPVRRFLTGLIIL